MTTLTEKVEETIDKALQRAESNWKESGSAFDELMSEGLEHAEVIIKGNAVSRNKSLTDFFPVDFNSSEERDLVCISADLRDSTNRIKTHFNDLGSYKNKFQRAYYITSALLPSLEVVINHYDGFVSEFLGDGVLGFFDAKKQKSDAIRNSGMASKYIVQSLSPMLEKRLQEYYKEEIMHIGVGLAMSPTLLSKVGLGSGAEIKAFGPCVYDASKLNFGRNEVFVESSLQAEWPKAIDGNGGLSFKRMSSSKVDLDYYRMIPNS
ncbi:hypothetical protein L1D46_16120 [Pseudoalteromonas sp. Isolate3]|uniref:hypothetical protein n=1 Tax=Pseudoalteromonas sp. Isolate3 TaxID=2908526 RepID=UPI001EFCD631|nr:hypothetical protein [Pseudoalteromonas sp. Isolate3]MCG9710323.1 hypothetical protein [Pseudoalteromonas sp. Isolate3]